MEIFKEQIELIKNHDFDFIIQKNLSNEFEKPKNKKKFC